MARLSPADRAALLAVVRSALRRRAGGGPAPILPAEGPLAAPGGAFVSVEVDGALRGSIGTCAPGEALAATAAAVAGLAAGADPRFPPLRPDEVERADVRVDAVGPLRPVSGPDDLDPARDGLRVQRGWHRGVLLPAAARRDGWDAAEALRRACLKAGLPPHAWRDPTCRVEAFAIEEIGPADAG